MSTANETTEVDALFDQSLKLTPEQRLEFADRLVLSVPPPGVIRTDEEWKQEIERRVEEYEADPNSVVPAEEVDLHVRQRIEDIRRIQDAGRE